MAVAATILIVVAVVVVGGNRSVVLTDPASSPTVTDPASSPTVTDPASSPTVADPVAPLNVVDALEYRWSRVADDDAVFDIDGVRWDPAMTSVTAGGPGLVAVGVTWNTEIDAVAWVATPEN